MLDLQWRTDGTRKRKNRFSTPRPETDESTEDFTTSIETNRLLDFPIRNKFSVKRKAKKDDAFPQVPAGFPPDYQLEGKEVRLFYKRAPDVRQLYGTRPNTAGESDYFSDETQFDSAVSDSSQDERKIDFPMMPDKLLQLKLQIGKLQNVILKRDKRIESLQNTVIALREKQFGKTGLEF